MQKRTILITGASGGIATELVKKLQSDPRFRLILHFKNKQSQRKLDKKLGKLKYESFFANYENIPLLKKRLSKSRFKVDILINNAGNYEARSFLKTDIDDLLKQININFLGLLIMTHYFARKMQNKNGRIINLSSGSGVHGGTLPCFGYAISKHSINFMTEILAEELEKSKIKINTIILRYVETPMLDKFRGYYKKIKNRKLKTEFRLYSSKEIAENIHKIINSNNIKSGAIIELK